MTKNNNVLTESSFLLYAANHYTALHFNEADFMEDTNRFKYLKRLLNKYKESGDLKERLILNHIIVIYNVFDAPSATKMLFFKLKDHQAYLKPFLLFLGYLPKTVSGASCG